jgi:hypothetical protein
VDQYELARRANELPAQYKARLRAQSFEDVNLSIRVGEWGEALDNLIAALCKDNTPITPEEHDELHALLTAIHLPTTGLDELEIRS